MKSCVVFAVSIFNREKLYVLTEFLDTFTEKFSNCDLYIGINYNSIPEVEKVIETYKLNLKAVRLQDSGLYCGSDASAYQIALKLLKAENKQYGIYWFAHTKGAVNDRPFERNLYLTQLFKDREYIEGLFKQYPKLGSYALRGVSSGAGGDKWFEFNHDHDIEICSNKKYGDLQFTHVNWSYIETMYAVAGKPVETFLKITSENFYDTKIADPCYFEIIFPWIVGRCGYFPYIKQDRCFWGTLNIKDITQKWIEENNLTELQTYLSI